MRATVTKRSNLRTTLERSELMRRVRRSDTPPERAVRRILHRLGARFRVQAKDLPGTPDIVNRSKAWAIFVHGCYWHAHECCERWRLPKRNREFWAKKFNQNRERDQRKLELLKAEGFDVLVVWQCEIESPDLEEQLRNFLSSSEDRAFLRSTIRRSSPRSIDRNIGVVDLFSGCGGMSLGLRRACDDLGLGFEVELAVDSDKRALRVYEDNFAPTKSSSRQIQDLLTGDLGCQDRRGAEGDLAKNLAGRVDVLLAGPPCQGHSGLNNKTRHADDRNSLYERVGRFAELVRPEHILIENVPTVVVDKNRAIHKTVEHLRLLGYWVDDELVSLEEIGVPQRRKRHIVLASLSWAGSLKSIVDKYQVPPRSVRWAIEDIGDLPVADASLLDRPSLMSEDNQKRIRYLIDHDIRELPNSERPSCHQNGSHSYKSMYGRLSWDKPAQTITTGFGSPGQGRFIHPSEPRTLTPHEAARIQFFPEFFDFSSVAYRSVLAKVIGNAVPCKLSWMIGLEILR